MITPELKYLAVLALWQAILWIPVVIGYVTTRGYLQPRDYVTAPTSPLPDWVNRANRAHMNAVENFSAFAATVLIAAVIGFTTPTTQILAAVFFWARIGHAVIHISGFNRMMARTVIFGVANTAGIIYSGLLVIHLFTTAM